MGCLFENNNKVCTCKIDELAREVCSIMAKEQGYTSCVYIRNDETMDTKNNENIVDKVLDGLTLNEMRKKYGLPEIDDHICNAILVKQNYSKE